MKAMRMRLEGQRRCHSKKYSEIVRYIRSFSRENIFYSKITMSKGRKGYVLSQNHDAIHAN